MQINESNVNIKDIKSSIILLKTENNKNNHKCISNEDINKLEDIVEIYEVLFRNMSPTMYNIYNSINNLLKGIRKSSSNVNYASLTNLYEILLSAIKQHTYVQEYFGEYNITIDNIDIKSILQAKNNIIEYIKEREQREYMDKNELIRKLENHKSTMKEEHETKDTDYIQCVETIEILIKMFTALEENKVFTYDNLIKLEIDQHTIQEKNAVMKKICAITMKSIKNTINKNDKNISQTDLEYFFNFEEGKLYKSEGLKELKNFCDGGFFDCLNEDSRREIEGKKSILESYIGNGGYGQITDNNIDEKVIISYFRDPNTFKNPGLGISRFIGRNRQKKRRVFLLIDALKDKAIEQGKLKDFEKINFEKFSYKDASIITELFEEDKKRIEEKQNSNEIRQDNSLVINPAILYGNNVYANNKNINNRTKKNLKTIQQHIQEKVQQGWSCGWSCCG